MRFGLYSLFLIFTLITNDVSAYQIEIDDINLSNPTSRLAINENDFVTFKIDHSNFYNEKTDFNYLGDDWVSMRWKDIVEHQIFSKYQVKKYGKLKKSSKWSNDFSFDFELEKRFSRNEKMNFSLSTWGNTNEIESLLLENGINDFSWSSLKNIVTVLADAKQIQPLLESSLISYIEPVSEERTPLLNTVGPILNINKVKAPENIGLNYKGEGIKIGVWDYGMTGFHKDIEGQYINVENDFYNASGTQHTTLVTSAIVSKGVLREHLVGVAPKSKVYVYNYFGKVLDEIIDAKSKYGVYLTNHSYNLGSSFRCFANYQYSTASAELDQLYLDEPQMIHLFAAGNSAVACPFDYKTIVPGFQYAKNALLIGNIENNETFYPGSAKGPTNDGRLAPHVMSKGSGSFSPTTGIVLPTPTDSYTNAYGTSFASPVATGIVALMQESYIDRFGELPNNALIKAILCNTAVDLGKPGPDYDYGFGKIDAFQAVQAIQNSTFFESKISYQEQKDFVVNVEDGNHELKVLLYWNDLPALLPNEQVLVNDLDIIVITPDNKIIHPLVLDHNVPSKIAEEGRDSINNIEQVYIKQPIAGEYTIRIVGHRVFNESQDFAISYSSILQGFQFNNPLKDEVLPANTVNIIRWNSKVDADSITLQYSIDGGDNWTNINTISSDQQFYSWTTPNGVQRSVLLRSIANGVVLATTDTFAISPRPTISSNSNCRNFLRVGWGVIPDATKYKILILNEQNEWVEHAETTANSYLYSKPYPGKEYFFSVKPVFENFDGLRSLALKLVANNNNNCSFAIKDVGIHSITPTEGAIHTEYELSKSENISIRVVNYANSVVNNVQLFYQVDHHDTVQVHIGNMTSNQNFIYTSDETYDFYELGTYTIRAWLTSNNDVNSSNDTLIHLVSQKESKIVSFPYLQDFEQIDEQLILSSSKVNIPEMEGWDYINIGHGRIYSNTSQAYAPNGQKGLNVDSYIDQSESVHNLYLNIDLSSQIDSLVYLDYLSIKRGEYSGADSIYIKPNPNSPWIPVYSIYSFNYASGTIQNENKINLSKIIQDRGQVFSDHSVLKFNFNVNRSIINAAANGGYSLDDIKLYNGGEDLELISINTNPVQCIYQNTMPYSIPISITFKNNSPHTIPANTVQLELYIDDTVKFVEFFPNDIHPYDSVLYEFSTYINIYELSNFQLGAKIQYVNDKILDNNSITNYSINLLKAIRELPVELTFDDQEEIQLLPSGNWYSWELGVPTKSYLYNVADNPGNAWVTKLDGLYPNNEKSYLYIGCLNSNLLTFNSELSFLIQYNLEFGADVLWLEYSYDGKRWNVLGTNRSGYNWYNPQHTYSYWDGDRLNWQVASMPLSAFANMNSPLFLRFAFETSSYIQQEGVAIDQLRINHQMNARIPIINKSIKGVSTGNGVVELKEDDIVYGYLNDHGIELGNIQMNISLYPDSVPAYRDKFLLPRSFHIEIDNQPTQKYDLTLFIKNDEYLNYLAKDMGARRMGEIGYLVYDGLNTDTVLSNNHFDENYIFYHPDSLVFWPYNDGYEIRFQLDKKHAEIYLTSNISNHHAYPFVAITDFDVFRTDSSNHTFVHWVVDRQNGVSRYDILYSEDAINFETFASIDVDDSQHEYVFVDESHNVTGQHYYRIRAIADSLEYTSLIDSISFEFVSVGIPQRESNSIQALYLGQGHISIESNMDTHANICLVDISGKIIDEWKSVHVDGLKKLHSHQLSKAAAGMYFIQIEHGNEIKSTKFVKSE